MSRCQISVKLQIYLYQEQIQVLGGPELTLSGVPWYETVGWAQGCGRGWANEGAEQLLHELRGESPPIRTSGAGGPLRALP